MAVYHLRWRGQRDGTQTGWDILRSDHTAVGRVEWTPQLQVVYNDGTLFQRCLSHEDTFQAAEALVALYEQLDRPAPDVLPMEH